MRPHWSIGATGNGQTLPAADPRRVEAQGPATPGGLVASAANDRPLVITGPQTGAGRVTVTYGRELRWLRAALIAAAAAAVTATVTLGTDGPALFVCFLPVALTGALFGWRDGAALAAICVAVVLAVEIHDVAVDGGIGSTDRSELNSVVIWAAALLLTGPLVGHLAQRAGRQRMLKELAARTSTAVERERKRVSYDIHDGIAQEAATALMETEILRSLCATADSEMQEQVIRIRDTLATLLKETRSMIGQLRPPPLDAAQFVATLENLVKDFENRTGIATDRMVSGDFTAHTDSMRICVYRVIQEALSNIEHHANASHAFICVSAIKSGVHMDISDDGEGFDPSVLHAEGGGDQFGLRGMQDRVANLSGRLEIISRPGSGTTIRAFCPGYRS